MRRAPDEVGLRREQSQQFELSGQRISRRRCRAGDGAAARAGRAHPGARSRPHTAGPAAAGTDTSTLTLALALALTHNPVVACCQPVRTHPRLAAITLRGRRTATLDPAPDPPPDSTTPPVNPQPRSLSAAPPHPCQTASGIWGALAPTLTPTPTPIPTLFLALPPLHPCQGGLEQLRLRQLEHMPSPSPPLSH